MRCPRAAVGPTGHSSSRRMSSNIHRGIHRHGVLLPRGELASSGYAYGVPDSTAPSPMIA